MHCKICGDEGLTTEDVCCVKCSATFHRECWELLGMCPSYECGCGEQQAYAEDEAEEPELVDDVVFAALRGWRCRAAFFMMSALGSFIAVRLAGALPGIRFWYDRSPDLDPHSFACAVITAGALALLLPYVGHLIGDQVEKLGLLLALAVGILSCGGERLMSSLLIEYNFLLALAAVGVGRRVLGWLTGDFRYPEERVLVTLCSFLLLNKVFVHFEQLAHLVNPANRAGPLYVLFAVSLPLEFVLWWWEGR